MEVAVFIRGKTGVGKTSVVHRIGHAFPAGATVHIDSIRALLHAGTQNDASQYYDAFGAVSLMALHFVECGYGPIFIVGHVTDELLEDWKKAGAPGGIRVYTLTASDEVLRRRNLVRTDRDPTREVRSIRPLRTVEEVVIDTSALDVEGVCKVILDDLNRGEEIPGEGETIFNYE